MHLNEILPLYGSQQPQMITSHNTSRGDDDYRMVYIVEFPGAGDKLGADNKLCADDKLAIKVTKNASTTSERVSRMGRTY